MTAGNSEQIQRVLDAGIMDPLLHVLQTVSYFCSKQNIHYLFI